MTLQQQIMHVWTELIKLEQRILCKLLPQPFDEVTLSDVDTKEDNSDIDLPFNIIQKKIQQLKRTMLDSLVQTCENTILQYEHQYQQELIMLEKNCSNSQCMNGISLIDSVNTYMANRINQMKHETRFKMTFYRTTLFRRRRRSSSAKNMIGVWPQTMVDVANLPLNSNELSFLSSAGERSFLLLSTLSSIFVQDQVILDRIKVHCVLIVNDYFKSKPIITIS